MNNDIFRKESVERISSPEQLMDYIHVTSPAGWLLLGAMLALLVGICVWGFFGKLDTKLTVAAESRNGTVVCYVRESDIQTVQVGMPVRIGDDDFQISDLPSVPMEVSEEIPAYAVHLGGLEQGEWVYAAALDGALPEGIYTAEIIVDRVAPALFVLN